jgi:hypothetical protein
MTILNKVDVAVKFEPKDLWLGIFWDWKTEYVMSNTITAKQLYVYVCLLPTLPIVLKFFPLKTQDNGISHTGNA